MKYSAVVALIISAAFAQTPERDKLYRIFAEAYESNLQEHPEAATFLGRNEFNDRWTDFTPDSIARYKAQRLKRLEALRGIDRSKLTPADQLNYDLFVYQLQVRTDAEAFPEELLALDPLFRGPNVSIPRILQLSPARTVKDYENLIARLRGSASVIDQTIALLQDGVKRGVTQPAIILRDVPEQLTQLSSGNPSKSPMLEAFRKFPPSIPAEEQTRLAHEASAAADGSLFPALQRLRDYLVKDYLPAARTTIARTTLPDGAGWYAVDVRQHTTTNWTPQKIHEIGLAEVKRIRAEMDTVIVKTGFKGDFNAFLEFLRTDPRFYYTKPEDLLTGYRDICKRIDPELPRLFGKLPRMTYGVRPVPDHIAPSETTARYNPGDVAGTRPGYFAANTYKLETRPKYEMEALTLHEAVPGHHLQIALGRELADVPEFRKSLGFNAFVEGWGLYAESLGEELGFYKDPYSKFGQLSYEMWRACRLVVDTGMHSMGWSRQQAIDFMKANTSSTEQNITVEADRYIAWPGQALAYKIGELKIKELRKRAEQSLGPKFDIRAFHDAVLANGALPLDILEVQVVQALGIRNP